MQERNSGPGPTGPDGSEQINQFDALARNMVRLFDQGTKVFSTLAERTRHKRQRPL